MPGLPCTAAGHVGYVGHIENAFPCVVASVCLRWSASAGWRTPQVTTAGSGRNHTRSHKPPIDRFNGSPDGPLVRISTDGQRRQAFHQYRRLPQKGGLICGEGLVEAGVDAKNASAGRRGACRGLSGGSSRAKCDKGPPLSPSGPRFGGFSARPARGTRSNPHSGARWPSQLEVSRAFVVGPFRSGI